MAEQPKPVVLILADISGYTRFMSLNAKTLVHTQSIITELMSVIIRQIELPLEVAKLEGDAVFLYCLKNEDGVGWREKKRIIGQKLVGFFDVFSRRVTELSQSTLCRCDACQSINELQLKLVVHSGEALFHQVGQFRELAGIDVIRVHRLLKNSVPAREYILMTEPAYHDIEFPHTHQIESRSETDPDLGEIDTRIFYPGNTADPGQKGFSNDIKFIPIPDRKSQPIAKPLDDRVRDAVGWYTRLWFGQFGAGKLPGAKQPSRISRTVFRLMILIITPIMYPVGVTLIALKEWWRK